MLFQKVFTHKCIDFDFWKIGVSEIFLSFNGTWLKIIKVPEFKCYNGLSVTMCHCTDEMINCSITSYNRDNKLVINKEGNRVFNHVKTGTYM